jgi:hypothetical protein
MFRACTGADLRQKILKRMRHTDRAQPRKDYYTQVKSYQVIRIMSWISKSLACIIMNGISTEIKANSRLYEGQFAGWKQLSGLDVVAYIMNHKHIV